MYFKDLDVGEEGEGRRVGGEKGMINKLIKNK